MIASYGYKERKSLANRFKVGEALIGQAALERKVIVITQAPEDYIKIASGLGEAAPTSIIVLPVLFEETVMAVIELASFAPFSEVQQTFLEMLSESIGVVLNTINANMRTEELLLQSQSLTQDLQSQSEELQAQQDELRRSNAELEAQTATLRASEELLQTQQEELQQTNEELEERSQQLEEQNTRIEIKNAEIEEARSALEEKAEQLALSSKYKSEFLANMSHELRTPLNSLLILAKLLGDNVDGNLTAKQIEFANTIHNAGAELLSLINDILDLSKVEAGKMDVHTAEVSVAEELASLERSFMPVAAEKGLTFELDFAESALPTVFTDQQRLQQVLKNLLSNAFKFTEAGGVVLRVAQAPPGRQFASETLASAAHVVGFSVVDTGVGIAADKLRVIFEAFQQADGTTSRRYGGTGLGLSISREIARLLGGEIHVESAPGEGSTFTLYLPDVFVEHAPEATGAEFLAAVTAGLTPATAALPHPTNGGDPDVDDFDPLAARPERGRGRPRRDRGRRPRRSDRRGRRRLRPHRAGDRTRARLQGARRPSRRHRARARTRVQAGRDRAGHDPAGDGRLDRARPAEAPSVDAAHPGAHRLRRRGGAARADGRRRRGRQEARIDRGAPGRLRRDRVVHRPRRPQAARRRRRRGPARRDHRAGRR